MFIRLLKLPFKAISLALIPVLLVLHLFGSLLLGLSSILTHILASVFLFGSAAGFITHQPADILTRTICIGLFLAVFPYVGEWLLGKLTSLTIVLLDFISA